MVVPGFQASAASVAVAELNVPSGLQSKNGWPRPFEWAVWQTSPGQHAVPWQQVPPHTGAPAPQQWPAMQVPPPHALLHVPQFAGLVWRSTHAPLQLVSPAGQVHAPELQDRPAGHALPHVPQFEGSVRSFTHALPHWSGNEPEHLQVALTQASFVSGQALPQPPQFAASVCVFTHAVGWTVGHRSGSVPGHPQVPVVQTSRVSWQGSPQVPQFFGSVAVSTHCGFPPQSVAPAPQAHEPPEHVAATGATEQTWPHAPQFIGSLALSTQVPVPAPQTSGSAAGQPQVPPAHAAPRAHRWKHEPQYSGLVRRSTQISKHSSWPAGQEDFFEQPESATIAASAKAPVGRLTGDEVARDRRSIRWMLPRIRVGRAWHLAG